MKIFSRRKFFRGENFLIYGSSLIAEVTRKLDSEDELSTISQHRVTPSITRSLDCFNLWSLVTMATALGRVVATETASQQPYGPNLYIYSQVQNKQSQLLRPIST